MDHLKTAREGVEWIELPHDKFLQRNSAKTVTERSIQLEGKEFIDKLTVCQFAKKPIKIHGVRSLLRYKATISSDTCLKYTFQAHFSDQ